MKRIIGIVGFIGSGKDTVADFLVENYGYTRDSFAAPLKDAAASVFGWDRALLEGSTPESRSWRNQIDSWWANRLGIPHITPRWVLQHWGTEVLREGFHDDIWIASLERRFIQSKNDIVISDVRFPNEMQAIRNVGGTLIRVVRGPEPTWFAQAICANTNQDTSLQQSANQALIELGIHASERAWVGLPVDYTVSNSGTIQELYELINDLVSNHLSAT